MSILSKKNLFFSENRGKFFEGVVMSGGTPETMKIRPFEIEFLSEFTVLRRYFPESRRNIFDKAGPYSGAKASL